jgi:ubiquinone biosynthesis protein
LDYADAFEQIRDKLHSEVRLDEEQRHLQQAAQFYADEPRIQIPALLDHCTPRVTAMERITGSKVADHRLQNPYQRRRLAELVVQALISLPMFSQASAALFHCDPHAGNLFLTDDQRLAVLDWSLVGRLDESQRVAIVQIMLGAVTLDAGTIVAVLESLSARQCASQSSLAAVVQTWLKQIRHGRLPGLEWLTGLLDDAVRLAQLRLSADLMLLRKSLHTLEGVIADVAGKEFPMDNLLMLDFMRHFVAEWPWRWMASPNSRSFATRLSNFDLLRTSANLPATVARFWAGQNRELFDACSMAEKLRN